MNYDVIGENQQHVKDKLLSSQVRAAQRRREYRRMNDFLIDGMYNDL